MTEMPTINVGLATSETDLVVELGAIGPQGPPGPEGPPGGTLLTGWWDYSTAIVAPPLLGEIRTAPATIVVGQPMTIWLSATDDSGLVWSGAGIGVGGGLRLRGTFGAVQYATITSYTLTVPGATGYATIVATATSITGQIAKNAKVEVSLSNPAPAGMPAKRVSSITSTGTLTVDTSAYDMAVLTAQAAALTVAAPTGVPVTGRELWLRFKDNGTARTISWNVVFRAVGVTLPITTVAGKTLYVHAIYNSADVRWDVVGVHAEA